MYKVILLCLFVQVAYSQMPITVDTCPGNSFYVSCMPICEPRCNVPTPPYCGSHAVIPQEMCHPGCVCPFGYYRNSQNKCVTLIECEPPRSMDLDFI